MDGEVVGRVEAPNDEVVKRVEALDDCVSRAGARRFGGGVFDLHFRDVLLALVSCARILH